MPRSGAYIHIPCNGVENLMPLSVLNGSVLSGSSRTPINAHSRMQRMSFVFNLSPLVHPLPAVHSIASAMLCFVHCAIHIDVQILH